MLAFAHAERNKNKFVQGQDIRLSQHFTVLTTIQYNTIFVYYELTERSSTRET